MAQPASDIHLHPSLLYCLFSHDCGRIIWYKHDNLGSPFHGNNSWGSFKQSGRWANNPNISRIDLYSFCYYKSTGKKKMFTVDKGCLINKFSCNWFRLANVESFAENIWVVRFLVCGIQIFHFKTCSTWI